MTRRTDRPLNLSHRSSVIRCVALGCLALVSSGCGDSGHSSSGASQFKPNRVGTQAQQDVDKDVSKGTVAKSVPWLLGGVGKTSRELVIWVAAVDSGCNGSFRVRVVDQSSSQVTISASKTTQRTAPACSSSQHLTSRPQTVTLAAPIGGRRIVGQKENSTYPGALVGRSTSVRRVPNIAGLTVSDASRALCVSALRLDAHSSTPSAAVVRRQRPAAGATIRAHALPRPEIEKPCATLKLRDRVAITTR